MFTPGKHKHTSSEQHPPVTAEKPAELLHFEAFVKPKNDNRRLFFALVSVSVVAIGLVLALIMLMPLKSVVPYVVKVNTDSGEVSVNPVGVNKYVPGKPEIQYFLAQWIIKTLSVDPYLTEKHYLPDAYAKTRGKATSEFLDWVNKIDLPMQRLQDDGTLTRSVKITSIPTLLEEDSGAIVRFLTEERSMKSAPKVKRWVATIHYTVIPPATEAEILSNPTGLNVTHFEFRDDLEHN